MDEDAVADIFAELGEVRCRRMFGGLGVYAEGIMFALVARDRLYLKADADFSEQLTSRGSEPFTYGAGERQVNLGYWSLPEAAFDDPEDAAGLARIALRVAHAAETAKPARKPRGKKPA